MSTLQRKLTYTLVIDEQQRKDFIVALRTAIDEGYLTPDKDNGTLQATPSQTLEMLQQLDNENNPDMVHGLTI